jgi:hypothetical protein
MERGQSGVSQLYVAAARMGDLSLASEVRQRAKVGHAVMVKLERLMVKLERLMVKLERLVVKLERLVVKLERLMVKLERLMVKLERPHSC